ncbi:hypothetical protein, partial [Aerosakkonema funiforme]|uniref:hypothetical protein n=1 Tax=Aerosakkonema funiforme TaxID=1246630 RepID=UPI001A7E4D2A
MRAIVKVPAVPVSVATVGEALILTVGGLTGSSVLSVINFAYQNQKFEKPKSLKSLLDKEVRQKG